MDNFLAQLSRQDAALGQLRPFAGANAQTSYLANSETKLHRKLCGSLEEAIKRSGLQDGMAISFHHAFREGDKVVNTVADAVARMGFKYLTLASSSLLNCHDPLIEHIKSRATIDPNFSGGDTMKATQLLHNLGQSLWLDNITRDLLTSGTLKRYIDELSVTGLTSNPTIFDHAIKNSTAYDDAIRKTLKEGKSAEELIFELALEDLTKALAAPFTVNTMPEGTLQALADHGDISEIMSANGGDCEAVLDQFAKANVDVDALAARLQDEGAKSFVNSWNELMGVIASKSTTLAKAS